MTDPIIREGALSNEDAADLALMRGDVWRVEVFDAQVGGSITLYYQTHEAAYQAAIRIGGWVQHHDGVAWVEELGATAAVEREG